MIRVFLGYDPREPAAYHVASHSILERSSQPVAIAPLALHQLGSVFKRQRDAKQATDFSFSRFLVPHLCGYEGWAIFMDCDILMLDDIAKLWALRDDRYAVQVVQHDHRPRESTKFLGQVQTSYPKKNWSSVMLMNGARCTALTPEYVNTASGLDLHRFNWLSSEDLVGALPHRWNHLVDYDPTLPLHEVSNLHFTIGGPWFPEYVNCSYAENWRAELEHMMSPTEAR
ncbi:glycosyltransferase [Verrucomicrobiaceae bacterium SCGC AG-212-N21]|nr:glycosyltransferase [Verrucomicrobiaceae bacterium SCGC AG-212-N21]